MPLRIKVVVLGDDGSGKTTLILRYLGKQVADIEPTLHPKLYVVRKEVARKIVEWVIWEIPSRTPLNERITYYRDADGAIIIFRATESIFLYRIYQWIAEFLRNCGNPLGKPFVIVANFADKKMLSPDARYTILAAKAYVEKLNVSLTCKVGFVETSAKLGQNVDLVFETIAKLILSIPN